MLELKIVKTPEGTRKLEVWVDGKVVVRGAINKTVAARITELQDAQEKIPQDTAVAVVEGLVSALEKRGR